MLLQVTVLEIGQAGSRDDQAAANGSADDEDRRRRAVVRPVGGEVLAADLVQPRLLLELHERAVRYHFPAVVLDEQI